MPWSISERDGKFCVVKDDDGEVEGCHETRAQALAQQRALYSSESATASLEIDWSGLDFDPAPKPILLEVGRPPEPPPLRIEVSPAPVETDEALVAALDALHDRLRESDERQAQIVEAMKELAVIVNADREQLAASLTALTAAIQDQPAPVVNIPEFPEIPAAVVNVPEPVVHVHVPRAPDKKLKIERDPVSGMIASATVEEVNERGR